MGTNKALTAQVDIMIANNDKVRDEMKANTAALVASLEAARKSADEQLETVNAASAARYDEVVKAVEDGIESARVKADARFTGVYDTMLKDRKKYDEMVAGAVSELNDSIAKNSAIEDVRFSKTVKDIESARKAAQIKINNKVDAEMDRLVKKSNAYEHAGRKYRGMIRKKIEEYKQAAAQETAELAKESRADVKKLRSEQAATLLQSKDVFASRVEALNGAITANAAHFEARFS